MIGDVDTTGMSKGEARAALKRGAKIARAAVRKQAMMEAKEKARLERMTDTQRAALAAEAEAKAKAKAESMTITDTLEELSLILIGRCRRIERCWFCWWSYH